MTIGIYKITNKGFLDIVMVSILIFFFWGKPDNWDKLNAIIDEKYSQIEQK